MSKKFAYFWAVAFLLVVRFGVLNTDYDLWLLNHGFENTGMFIAAMKVSPTFNEYVGNWALVVFVCTVLAYWSAAVDDQTIPMHFLLLPIAYIPFNIVGTVLMTAQFQVSYLWVQPLVILPFGFLYVGIWKLLIWLFEKLHLIG